MPLALKAVMATADGQKRLQQHNTKGLKDVLLKRRRRVRLRLRAYSSLSPRFAVREAARIEDPGREIPGILDGEGGLDLGERGEGE
ncbi:hypothetical protein GW17_00038158 [Ensete ventricosum]|nr:hypothetical protein GW17_00038158 [Ensete ventricosum]